MNKIDCRLCNHWTICKLTVDIRNSLLDIKQTGEIPICIETNILWNGVANSCKYFNN